MDEVPDLFLSAWLKWGWASAYAEVLKAEIRDFNAKSQREDAVTASSHYKPQSHCFVIVADTIPEFPPRIGLILGDVVQNYRSSLDHLAWALVKTGRTPSLSRRTKKLVYFPYAKTPTEFREIVKRRLPGVRRTDLAKVRRYQPYKAGKRLLARHPLTTLEKLSNFDKHRTVQPVWAVPIGTRLKVEKLDDCIITRVPQYGRIQYLKIGAEFARIYVRKTGPNPRIEMKGALTVEPSVHEFARLGDWLDKTNAIIGAVLREFSDPPESLVDTIAPQDTEHVFP